MFLLPLAAVCFALAVYAVFLFAVSKRCAGKIKTQERLEKLCRSGEKSENQKKIRDSNGRLSPKDSPRFGETLFSRIQTWLSMAGVMLKAEEFVFIWVITGVILPLLAFWVSMNVLAAFGIAIFGILLPPLLVMESRKKKMALFETQLSDALIVISNCLKAGFTFQQAMESIADEMPDPISREFGKTLREVRLGVSMETALQNMVARLRDEDLDLLVSAVVIQKQVGGNLAEILDNIADTVKERLRIRGEIKVMTSSGRMSGIIVGLIPLFLFAFLMVVNPSYVSMFFTTSVGMAMLIVSVIMETIGFLVIRKIVNVKF